MTWDVGARSIGHVGEIYLRKEFFDQLLANLALHERVRCVSSLPGTLPDGPVEFRPIAKTAQ